MSVTKNTVALHIQTARCFSTWGPLRRSHYDTLGVSRSSSQADIKSAFYKLSKKHHPDANVNDPAATSKFQEIAEAYEILGNEDARKRYDVGMGPVNVQTKRDKGFKAPDDPKAAFYKSRLQNRMNSTPTATRAYNFDEWTRQHYTESLKASRAKAYEEREYEERKQKAEKNRDFQETERKTAYGVLLLILFSLSVIEFIKHV